MQGVLEVAVDHGHRTIPEAERTPRVDAVWTDTLASRTDHLLEIETFVVIAMIIVLVALHHLVGVAAAVEAGIGAVIVTTDECEAVRGLLDSYEGGTGALRPGEISATICHFRGGRSTKFLTSRSLL
jgi:hypothetical protein